MSAGQTAGTYRAKLGWAKIKINELQIEVDQYRLAVQAACGGKLLDWTLEGEEYVARVKTFPIQPPDEIPLRAGDAIHNMRQAIDHLAFAIATNGNGNGDKSEFPIFLDPNYYRLKRDSKLGNATVAAPILELIDRAQPFAAPDQDELWLLHGLDNYDKHRTLPVVAGATGISGTMMVGPAMAIKGPPGPTVAQGEEVVRVPRQQYEGGGSLILNFGVHFADGVAQDRNVYRTLSDIHVFIESRIIAPYEALVPA